MSHRLADQIGLHIRFVLVCVLCQMFAITNLRLFGSLQMLSVGLASKLQERLEQLAAFFRPAKP
jgi:hypothetical protein